MAELVVMFPDLRGEGSLGDFGKSLQQISLPAKTVLVPVLNGGTIRTLTATAKKARANGFEPIIALGKNLSGALITGCLSISVQYPEAAIVRLDTAEHDLSFIKKLAETACELKGMVIGDLCFDQNTLIEGTPDWFAHLKYFPLLYSQFTEGKLSLSCAHGFNSFAPGVMIEVLYDARSIISRAEEISGFPIFWGFDAAMVLAAYQLGIPVEIVPVPAQIVRNRDPQKIAAQLNDTLMICLASLATSGGN